MTPIYHHPRNPHSSVETNFSMDPNSSSTLFKWTFTEKHRLLKWMFTEEHRHPSTQASKETEMHRCDCRKNSMRHQDAQNPWGSQQSLEGFRLRFCSRLARGRQGGPRRAHLQTKGKVTSRPRPYRTPCAEGSSLRTFPFRSAQEMHHHRG